MSTLASIGISRAIILVAMLVLQLIERTIGPVIVLFILFTFSPLSLPVTPAHTHTALREFA